MLRHKPRNLQDKLAALYQAIDPKKQPVRSSIVKPPEKKKAQQPGKLAGLLQEKTKPEPSKVDPMSLPVQYGVFITITYDHVTTHYWVMDNQALMLSDTIADALLLTRGDALSLQRAIDYNHIGAVEFLTYICGIPITPSPDVHQRLRDGESYVVAPIHTNNKGERCILDPATDTWKKAP